MTVKIIRFSECLKREKSSIIPRWLDFLDAEKSIESALHLYLIIAYFL
jgi:hypothetical protein